VQVVVTGAAGFLGRILVDRILREWDGRFLLVDREAITGLNDSRVTQVTGELSEVDLGAALQAADVVFHLAALPGGAAEQDYAVSQLINLEVPLRLLDTLAARKRPVRFVYASSVAVFGVPFPRHIDDSTPPFPTMTYGAQKLMVETALGNLTRLGCVAGIALRLCGLLARPAAAAGLRSGFMSELFHSCVARRPMVLPTGPDATIWIMSASRAAENLIHAAGMTHPRALTLPALRVTVRELVAAVSAATGSDPASISYEPDEDLECQFGRLPPLSTDMADSLGFRHDGELTSLVARALRDAGVGR
jgi:D-erythronate 2-dehydrogenase